MKHLTEAFLEYKPASVSLYDMAKLHVTVDGKPAEISLAIYNILLHGVSWYNKFGYVSDRFEAEQEYNNQIRQKKITKQLFTKITNIVPEWKSDLHPNMTHQEIMRHIDTELRREPNPDYYKACITLLTYVKPKIEYDILLFLSPVLL
jgi:hypothetical protein